MKTKVLVPVFISGAVLLLATPSSSQGALAALWRFDSDTGATQSDSSTNANTASVLNGATWVMDGTRSSGVMSFDGFNDYLEAADSASLSITGNLTIALWVNVTSAGGFGQWRGLVTKDPAGSGNSAPYQFWFNQANLFPNYVAGDGTNNNIAFSSVDIPSTGVWQHWAVTLTGSTVAMYRNGLPIFMSDSSISPVTPADGNGPLWIGDRPGPQDMSFFGSMDDVAIFNEALDLTQINTIMSGDFSAFIVPEPSRVLLIFGGLLVASLRRRRQGGV